MSGITVQRSEGRREPGSLSGILCTGFVGGAVVPLFIGKLGDRFGLRSGMLLLYLTFACVMSAGFRAKPLITNAVMRSKRAAHAA